MAEPSKRDTDIHALAAQAASPRALQASLQYLQYTGESSLPATLRELAILQVGYCLGSSYEWTHHIEVGQTVGLTDADIHAIHLESTGHNSHLDELPRSILRAARTLTVDIEVDPATEATIRRTLTNEQYIDLVAVIGFYSGVIRALVALKVTLEDRYVPLLRRFPLPG